MESIKACPHCGGTASLTASYSQRTRLYITYVKCDICGAQGKAYFGKENPAAEEWDSITCRDAVNAWNMRTAEAEEKGA